ncbi:hypothetical protein R3I94_001916 [Phoxinus phoxinus]|uniref:BEN domain-containing protein n=1 Tax=Phoxinus phoxinus TaxID=58324 RepID=A0AAN9H738_9TELE
MSEKKFQKRVLQLLVDIKDIIHIATSAGTAYELNPANTEEELNALGDRLEDVNEGAELVEIYPGSEVFVSRSAWRAASYAITSTAMVRCLICSVFDMETLLRSNLRGGKSKTACGEEARDGLDSGKVKAIMNAVIKRHEKATVGHLGQAINSKLAELRFQNKKK